jgi:hypothetical protein
MRISNRALLKTTIIAVGFLAGCYHQIPLESRAQTAAPAIRVVLSANKQTSQSVIVAPTASEKSKQSAATLAEYLGRISSASFEVKTGDGKSGIAVGTAEEFPSLGLQGSFAPGDLTRREEYLLRSHAGGVWLLGATDLAVEHAVWDFLYRLGYRQFFPGAHWEIVPNNPNLAIAVNEQQKPDYYARRIWFTYGTWPENGRRMGEWSRKNRAVSGIALNTGHANAGIISRNKAEFVANPDYLAPVNGKPVDLSSARAAQAPQFNVANPGLRQLVVNDALNSFEKNPDLDSVSVDPNDGSHWGDSPEEQKIGSISDRVTLLANNVAEAVNKKYAGKYVGFYAYNKHSPPPSIRVNPNVVVSVATAFISGGFTVDQLIEGWQKQGATIGMREYYSIIHWDKDLPFGARAGRPEYMVKTIPHFYANGARFMSAESSDNWGPNGLGYYLAGRILWDVDEAKNVPALIEDFLDKSFGTAKEPMREVYGLLNGIGNAKSRPLSDDYVGRLYRSLQAAYAQTTDKQVRNRIDDLALYTRYIELYLKYTAATKEERQKSYEEVIRFAYRIRDTHMLHSLAIYRTGFRDKSVTIPVEAHWQKPEKDKAGKPVNPWKQDAAFTSEQIQEMVKTGVENNKLLDFEPVDFSSNLVSSKALNLTVRAPQSFTRWRGSQEYWVWMDAPGTLTLQARAGTVYNSRGSAKVLVFHGEDIVGDSNTEEEGEEELLAPVPIETKEVPPDTELHDITFTIPKAGLYCVRGADRMMGTQLQFTPGTPVVVRSALGRTTGFGNRWNLYFYVPKGTKYVGGFAYGDGKIHNGDGKVVFTYPPKNSYFSIPVEAGQDGKLWMFESIGGQIGLMTVPPYLARSAEELLLPKEVILADAS